jgi:hypothetical protein
MKDPHPLLLWLYRAALIVYPLRLRFQYRDQMLQTLCDAYYDRPAGKMRFWLRAYADLIQSSFRERFNMARDEVVQSPLVFHTLALAAIISLLGGGAALVIDQMMRVGAGNQPQMEMADWYVGEISAGEEPGNVIPPGYVDLERSLQPFVIFYDDQGRPLRGTGYLDQKLPAPPPGVFELSKASLRDSFLPAGRCVWWKSRNQFSGEWPSLSGSSSWRCYLAELRCCIARIE